MLLGNVKNALLHYRSRLPGTVLHFILRGTRIIWYLPDHNRAASILRPFHDKGFIPVKIYFIYLFKFLSHSFTTREKLDILIFHYSVLQRNFSLERLSDIFGQGLVCWHQTVEDHVFKMTITSPTPYEEEGSLALSMSMDGEDIYSLAFTFAIGTRAGWGSDPIIYVARIQGVHGKLEQISKASKIFSDNNPAALLISALEAIALCMGIKKIIGIQSKNQIGYNETRVNFAKTYDAFWETFEVSRLPDDDYLIHVPIHAKDLTLIKSRRRKRTVRKRMLRQDLSNKFYQNFEQFLQRTEDSHVPVNVGEIETMIISPLKIANVTALKAES